MTKYSLGRRKEYQLMENLRKQGFDIVFRSAGSHSSIDVIGIKKKTKEIYLIQSKRILKKTINDKPDIKTREKLIKENQWLKGLFNVFFIVK